MKRRAFLKFLGITTAGVVITPTVVVEALAKKEENWYFNGEIREKIKERLDLLNQYPMTPEESFRRNIIIHYEDKKWIYYSFKDDPKHRINWFAKSEFALYAEAQVEFEKIEYEYLFGHPKKN